ncbi:MAG: hypothetical protein VW618_05905, partial [Alphaproteobacteria bacterium]
MYFECGDIDYVCDAEIDPRGVHGVEGFRPYFEKVTFKKAIKTNEPEDRIEKLKKNVERRCPVSNLIRDAVVDLYIDVDRRADIACAFSRKRNGPALGRPFFVSVENALSA